MTRLTMEIDCPVCGTGLDCHDRLPGEIPAAGDTALCWHCGAVGIFATDDRGRLTIRRPTPAELAQVQAMPEYRDARHAIAESMDAHTANALRSGQL